MKTLGLLGSSALVPVFAVAMSATPAFAQATGGQQPTAATCPDGTPAAADGSCPPSSTAGPATATNANGAPQNNGQEIVITGSRIQRSPYTTPYPLETIGKDEITLSGSRSPAEVLQGSTITAGTAQINNTFLNYVSEGGPGANTVGLNGLDSERTLVLLNGRRMSPAGAGAEVYSTDLNVLPSLVIQRIDVEREGASSVYGSDAIAGVINIITDTKFNGLQLDAQTNQVVDNGGGGRTYRVSVLAGHTWSNAHILASFDYRESTALLVGDRADYSCPTDLIYQNGQQVGQKNPNGIGLRCFPFENGKIGIAQDYLFGANFTTGAQNRYTYVDGDINNLQLVNNLDLRPSASRNQLLGDVYQPVRTFTGYANGGITLFGDSELYAEGLFTRRESSQVEPTQLVFDPNQLGFDTYGGTYGGVSVTDAFGVPSSPFFPNSLAAAGNNLLRVFIVPNELNTSRQRVDYYRADGGLRGSTGIGDVKYDANVMYAESRARYELISTANTDTQKLRNSLMPVLAPAGTPQQYITVAAPGEAGAGKSYTCASNVTNGAYNGGNCVAGDFFNPQALAGDLPQNLLNYLTDDTVGHTSFQELTAQLDFNGSLFRLPAGPLGFSIGADYRHDKLVDVPSIEAQTGNYYNYSSGGITRGADAVEEVYGELNIPIVKGKPLFRDLSLSASGRYTHDDAYGSNWTYRLNGNWTPAPFFRIRGNYGTSFRSPSLYELDVANQTAFGAFDPCDRFASALAPTTNTYKNCLADLTAALGSQAKALAFQATGFPEIIAGGGKGVLKAEHATSWGAGIVIAPPHTGFSFAADYFNIRVNGEVSQLGDDVLIRCYQSDNFRSGNQYCALIAPRETTQGDLVQYHNPFLNVATQKVSGINFNLQYTHLIGAGRATLNVDATRTLHQYYQTFADEPQVDYVGTFGEQQFAGGPKWVGTARLDYAIHNVTLHYQLDYVGPMQWQANNIPVFNGLPAASDLRANVYILNSASIQYTWPKIGRITFGVNNLFNKKPEEISSTDNFPRVGNYFNYSGYDFIGRTAFLEITHNF